jgi:serine O-acetyltransferase
MQLEIPRSELEALVSRQIETLFGFRQEEERASFKAGIAAALERCEFCFSHTKNKYYAKDGSTYFNPFHSGQYSIFLYFLSNSIFSLYPNLRTLADRVYYLNKALNGLDLFYEVKMPRVFFLDHPIGSVLGRATYGEGFAFAQNCTVGNNKGVYPVIGQNVRMMASSMILGACNIGDNVIISAQSYVKDVDIPPCSIVFGAHPNLVVKARDESYFRTG